MGRTKRVTGKEADKAFRENGIRRIETAMYAAKTLALQKQGIKAAADDIDLEEAKRRFWRVTLRLDGEDSEDDDGEVEAKPERTKLPRNLIPTMAILDSMYSAIVDSLHDTGAAAVHTRATSQPSTARAAAPALPNIFITQRDAAALEKPGKPARQTSPRLVEQFHGARGYAQSMQQARRTVAPAVPSLERAPQPRLPARFVRAETMARQRVDELCDDDTCVIPTTEEVALKIAREGLPRETAAILEHALRPRKGKPAPRHEAPAMQVVGPAFVAAFERQRAEERLLAADDCNDAPGQPLLRSASLAERVVLKSHDGSDASGPVGDSVMRLPPLRATDPATAAAPRPTLQRSATELPPLLQKATARCPAPELAMMQACPVRVLLRCRPSSRRLSFARRISANLPERWPVDRSFFQSELKKTLEHKMQRLAEGVRLDVPLPSRHAPTSLRRLQAIASLAAPISADATPRPAGDASAEAGDHASAPVLRSMPSGLLTYCAVPASPRALTPVSECELPAAALV